MNSETIAKLTRIARRIGERSRVDSLDLLQEGVLRLWQTGIVKTAIGAMQEYARRERAERQAINEAAMCWKQLRRSSRSFDGLDEALKILGPRERRIIDCWLLGSSLSEIGSTEGCHNKTIKRALITAVTAIAAWCGKNSIDMEAVFPETTRLLPKGIRNRDGRFIAYAGHSGRIYLGTYDSLEQAIEARRRWPADFVVSPLDVL